MKMDIKLNIFDTCYDSQIELLKIITNNFSNIEIKNESEDTLFTKAAELGQIECLKYLLSKNANKYHKNKYGCTALHNATKGGHDKCMIFLINEGLSVNDLNVAKSIPLHYA